MPLLIASQCEPIPGYRLLDKLGSGGFGEVWRAEAPGGLIKAIKIINGDLRAADPEGARHAEQELKALKRVQAIRHPYLLSLERYDIVDGRLLIVMELADCNLWDRFRDCRSRGLPGVPREELIGYLEESAEVLDLMNNQFGLQHLDIKPQNLFLVHNHVKVADFGLVKDLEGMRAAITGGVTPVYAAPETFDGVATRFCDQYSLSIVYQELLTGVRPFNGTNGQQLLVQHMQGLPNLTPLPAADRPAVGRALAKKPEDRFPTCLEFIRALYRAGSDVIGGGMPATFGTVQRGRLETPGEAYSTNATARSTGMPFPPAEAPPETPKTELRFRRDEGVSSPSLELAPKAREAPPEQIGSGVLVPAVVVGIGQIGIDVVRKLRRQIADRYGSLERLPHLRVFCIDTDPDALQAASSPNAAAPLTPGELVPMRLNRASHYLKPRRNGRSLIEGWFDPQMLYRIPRNPQTLGLRCLGRLAFCDHYRTFAAKLTEDIESCSHSDAIARSDKQTKLGLRTNRPRVYIVAGLGGGTGSGMFIDAAYAARHRLRQLGFNNPDVVGLFLAPPADRGNAVKPQAIANTFAALRELNHFSLPETVYSASFDDKDANINDAAPPCRRIHFIPQDVISAKPGDVPAPETASSRAADMLRRDLLSPLGRAADDSRSEFGDHAGTRSVSVSIPNEASFLWPKQLILSHASHWLGEALITRWLKTDVVSIREPVRNWLKERWNAEDLGPEFLMAKLKEHAEKAIGQPLEAMCSAEAQPFVPRGWFARDPDPAQLWQAVSRLVHLVGMPDERAMQRQVGQLEPTLERAADELVRELAPRLLRLPRTLLEHADYRVSGAEEAVEQLQGILTQLIEYYEPIAVDMADKSIDAYYSINQFLTAEHGRRKPSPAELAEHLRCFPNWRFQSLVIRQVCRTYMALRSQLADLTREIRFCRQRLEDLMTRFRNLVVDVAPVGETTLFPAGCSSVEQAVKALRESILPDQMRTLDKGLQKQIEIAYQALFSVCMSSINMLGNLQGVIEEQTRSFLAIRLGELNVGQMFFNRFADADAAVRAMKFIHDRAAPPVATVRPVTKEICIVAVPEGDMGEAFQKIARQALQGKMLDFTTGSEEILVYREWPLFPLSLLPQLGPQAADAYNQMTQSGQGTPHARTDVSQWFDV
jgi:eukaryotic-like serine/threonine-protein kinase